MFILMQKKKISNLLKYLCLVVYIYIFHVYFSWKGKVLWLVYYFFLVCVQNSCMLKDFEWVFKDPLFQYFRKKQKKQKQKKLYPRESRMSYLNIL